MSSHTADFNFAPTANGVDFLDKAMEYLRVSEPSALKHAVLNLHAAAEILVKVRLEREGWQFLIADGVPDQGAFERGEFRSVTLQGAIKGLRDHAGIKLPNSHRKTLTRLEAERNKLQHFGHRSTMAAVESIAGKALDVLAVFIRTHLIPAAPASQVVHLQNAEKLIAAALTEIDAVVTARLARIAPLLDSRFVVHCPECLQLGLCTDEDQPVCLYCDATWAVAWESGPDLASAYAGGVLGLSWYMAIKDGGELPVRLCPGCEQEALVHPVEVRGRGEMFVCFACDLVGEAGRFDSCARCGELVYDEEMTVCSNCFAAAVGGV